jgi:hypothetical protein
MKKLAFKAVSLGLSMLGGSLAGAIVKRGWKLAAGEDEAPKATDQSYGWADGADRGGVPGSRPRRGEGGAGPRRRGKRPEADRNLARRLTGTWPDD